MKNFIKTIIAVLILSSVCYSADVYQDTDYHTNWINNANINAITCNFDYLNLSVTQQLSDVYVKESGDIMHGRLQITNAGLYVKQGVGQTAIEIDAYSDNSYYGHLAFSDLSKPSSPYPLLSIWACATNLTVSDYYFKFGSGANDIRLKGVRTPVANNEAANKEYVDGATNAAADTCVKKSGDSMEGNLCMEGNRLYLDSYMGSFTYFQNYAINSGFKFVDYSLVNNTINFYTNALWFQYPVAIRNLSEPDTSSSATTKNYVDSVTDTKLSLSGGTMTGNLNMGGNSIHSIDSIYSDVNLRTYKLTGLGDGTSLGDSINLGQFTGGTNAVASTKLSLSGDTMTGALSMGNGSSWNDIYIGNTTTIGDLTGAGSGFKFYDTIGGAMMYYTNALYFSNPTRISNVNTPINTTDAATKGYVDANKTNAIADAKYVNVAGDFMYGDLNVSNGQVAASASGYGVTIAATLGEPFVLFYTNSAAVGSLRFENDNAGMGLYSTHTGSTLIPLAVADPTAATDAVNYRTFTNIWVPGQSQFTALTNALKAAGVF